MRDTETGGSGIAKRTYIAAAAMLALMTSYCPQHRICWKVRKHSGEKCRGKSQGQSDKQVAVAAQHHDHRDRKSGPLRCTSWHGLSA
jgi:hypothetical protein